MFGTGHDRWGRGARRAAPAFLAFVVAFSGSAPAGSESTDPVDGGLDPRAALADPGEWLTDGLAARLLAGEQVPLSEIPGFPFAAQEYLALDPAVPYARIRPGMVITFRLLGVDIPNCTANYVFALPGQDRFAIGTAGHCTFVGEGQRTLLVSPVPLTLGFVEFGRTIFSTGNAGVGNDFALIEIHPLHRALVHPAISLIDGPCGWRRSFGLGDPIQYYGHGVGVGAGGQPRTGVVTADEGNVLRYARFPAGAPGDSGSPVRFVLSETGEVDLAAAAINTHGLAQLGSGTSMPRILELLALGGQGDWQLVDSPNCETL